MFNLNFVQTILTVLIFIDGFAYQFLGCTSSATGVADCSASWLPPAYTGIAVMVLGAIKLGLKFFQGGGSAALTHPTATVKAGGEVGTVSPTSVVR